MLLIFDMQHLQNQVNTNLVSIIQMAMENTYAHTLLPDLRIVFGARIKDHSSRVIFSTFFVLTANY